MALFATYDKTQRPWKRRTGIYGHLPKFTMRGKVFDSEEDLEGEWVRFRYPRVTYCGYLCLLTKNHQFSLYYQGNPGYRGRKWQILEIDGTPYPFPSRRIR